MDYLINVAVAARSYLFVALVLFVVAHWVRPKFAKFSTWKKVKSVSFGIAIAGVVVGISSPSNTPKLTVNYNKSADLRSIETLNAQRRPAVVVDISRQPQTAEEREAGAVDMRERVTASEVEEREQ
jgi:hypothetical protein